VNPMIDPAELRPGLEVRGSDGALGCLREHAIGVGPEHAYLVVERDGDTWWVPDRLIREKDGATVVLNLPVADVIANSSRGQPPIATSPAHLPEEVR
jgi:hypothetical protein